jgi:hypothetical protein
MKKTLYLLLAGFLLGLAASLWIWRDLVSLRPALPPISAEMRQYGEDLDAPTRALLAKRLPDRLILTGPRRDALADLGAIAHVRIRGIEPLDPIGAQWVTYSVGGMTLAEALEVIASDLSQHGKPTVVNTRGAPACLSLTTESERADWLNSTMFRTAPAGYLHAQRVRGN